MTVAITIISSSLHWLWLFWEILRDSYLASYISVTVNTNNEWSLHSYFQNKYNKLTPIFININAFISATTCKQVWVNWMEQPAVLPTNDIVVRYL